MAGMNIIDKNLLTEFLQELVVLIFEKLISVKAIIFKIRHPFLYKVYFNHLNGQAIIAFN